MNMIGNDQSKNALYTDWLLFFAGVLIFIRSAPNLLYMWEPDAFAGPDAAVTLGSLYFMYTRGRRLYIRKKIDLDTPAIDEIARHERIIVRSALWSGVLANFVVAFIPTLILMGMTIAGISSTDPISKRAECYAFLTECIQRDSGYLIVLGLEIVLSALVFSLWKYRTLKIYKNRLLFTLVFIITFFLSSTLVYHLMFIPAFLVVILKHGFV